MRKQIVVLGISILTLTSAYAQSDVNSQTVKDVFTDYGGATQKTGVEFHHKDATVGSAYMSKNWTKGSVTNLNDTIINNPAFLFNYNKMSGALLVTQDQNTYIELNSNGYKAFTLVDELGMQHKYVRVPAISALASAEEIATGANYTLYKYTKTKFKRADYVTDGLTERGNNYDEYVDESEYYVVNNKEKNATATKIAAKKKAFKDAFGADGGKVDQYVAQHKGDLNAAYYKDLIDFLNQ